MDSLIELKEHEDLSLSDEADRNWQEVLDQTYIFDRRQREVRRETFFFYSAVIISPSWKLYLNNSIFIF